MNNSDGSEPRIAQAGEKAIRRELRDLAILGATAFLALQIAFHLFDLRCVNPDVELFLARTINYVDTGQAMDRGSLIAYCFRLSPFANYWSLLPLAASRDLHAQYWFSTLQDITREPWIKDNS